MSEEKVVFLSVDDEDEVEEEDFGEEDFEDNSENSISYTFSIQNTVSPEESKFITCINYFKSLLGYFDNNYDNYTELITFKIPAKVLPLALQHVCGFTVDKTLLNVSLKLNGYSWRKPPLTAHYEHPVYGENYVGKVLINEVFNNFFSESYVPRKEYRCSKNVFLASGCEPNRILLKEIMQLGFEELEAENALILTRNDINDAIDFLNTGETIYDVGVQFSYNDCPLGYLVLEIIEAFLDIRDHCLICRRQLSDPTVRPFPCDSELCQHSFQNLGVGTSLIAEIKRDVNAADLLTSVCACAVGTNFLNPKPPHELILKEIFQKLPPMSKLALCETDGELFKSIGENAFDVLKWIILSNKSQLISIPKDKTMQQFNSVNQFITLMSSAEKERKFRELRKKHGSVYMWHGSTIDRWHSIIRNGLVNASGTKMQQHGTARGNGIYFARNISKSLNYTHGNVNNYMGSVWKNITIISLCEVVNDSSNLKDYGDQHTLQDSNECIVRFMFVNPLINQYDTLSTPPTNIPTLHDILQAYANSK